MTREIASSFSKIGTKRRLFAAVIHRQKNVCRVQRGKAAGNGAIREENVSGPHCNDRYPAADGQQFSYATALLQQPYIPGPIQHKHPQIPGLDTAAAHAQQAAGRIARFQPTAVDQNGKVCLLYTSRCV